MSGSIVLETGSATLDKGNSGTITIQAGSAGLDHIPRGYNIYSNSGHAPSSFETSKDDEGGQIELFSGTKYDGIGGTLNLTAGGGSFRGGELVLTAGIGLSDANGGDGYISAGPSGKVGGSMTVQGGKGREGGGNVRLLGGDSSNSGGDVKGESGRTKVGRSGAVVISSAGTYSTSSETSGHTTLTSGPGSSSSSGIVRVTSGASALSNSGDVLMQSSDAHITGNVRIGSGDAASLKSGHVELISVKAALTGGRGTTGKITLGTSSAAYGDSGEIKLVTGDAVNGISGNVSIATGVSHVYSGHVVLKASQSQAKGGNIELEAGSSQHMGAGDINLKSGMGSSDEVGGNINIFATTASLKRNYNYYDHHTLSITQTKEINFGFDEVHDDSTTHRQINLQLKKSKNSTRLVSTVPLQVTTVQCE